MQKCSEYLLSDAGAPVANAQITVYYFGTSTLAPLFATATGVAIANPIASLSNGYFEFYAVDGQYTLAIVASGFSLRTATVEIINDNGPIYSAPSGVFENITSLEFDPEDSALRVTHGDAVVVVPLGASNPLINQVFS